MNKTDMLNEAKRLDEMGVDPDKIMVTYTPEEYAESHGEELDSFDVDKASITDIINQLEELDLQKQDIIKDIEAVNEIIETEVIDHYRRQELAEEIRESQIRLSQIESKQRALHDLLLQKQDEFDKLYGGR